jgi:hypothetical protein
MLSQAGTPVKLNAQNRGFISEFIIKVEIQLIRMA